MSDEIEGDIPSREVRALWNAVLGVWLCINCLVAFELTHTSNGQVAWYGASASFFGMMLIARFGPSYRTFGLAVPGSAVMLGTLMFLVWSGTSDFVVCLFGVALGCTIGACAASSFWQYRANLTAGQSVRELSEIPAWALRLGPLPPILAATVTEFDLDAEWRDHPLWAEGLRWYLLLSSAVTVVWCWLRFFRPFFELCLEPIFRILYRVKASGSKGLPPFGPCLVIANHACWFDPCFLGMILPRPITPIMTQRFYNQWFLKPILKYVFRVIVVPETPMKRETPELEQAVAALDRGEVVVIFPEGYLRRKEEVPLRRFGQGVWHILRARPDTPVVACWIEGGWGSKFSYKNGPPTKNKPMDFRRKIEIAASQPETVAAELLADGMGTRIYLMNRVSAMRAALGLAPLPTFGLPSANETETESA